MYERISHELIVKIAARFNIGGLPKHLIPYSHSWNVYMLQQIGGLTEESYRLMAEEAGNIGELIDIAIRRSCEVSLGAIEPELQRAIQAPGYVPKVSDTVERVVNNYESQALNRCNLVNTVMLNSSLNYYQDIVRDAARAYSDAQKILNQETGAVAIGAKAGTQAVRDAVKRMAASGVPGFVDKAGRQWEAQAYIEMDMRTTVANTAREAAMQRNEDYGNHLIMVSSHAGARPKCEPWQGRVYSTDNSSGTVKQSDGSTLDYIPLSQTSYGDPGGLFGINCGHMSFPFIPGASKLNWPSYDSETSQQLYKESQQQRYMERKIRKAKTEADALKAAGDDEGAKEARRNARRMNAELKEWCEKRGRDYYPERTRIVRTDN